MVSVHWSVFTITIPSQSISIHYYHSMTSAPRVHHNINTHVCVHGSQRLYTWQTLQTTSYGHQGSMTGLVQITAVRSTSYGHQGSMTGLIQITAVRSNRYGHRGTMTGLVQITAVRSTSYGHQGCSMTCLIQITAVRSTSYGHQGTMTGLVQITAVRSTSYGHQGSRRGLVQITAVRSTSYGYQGSMTGLVQITTVRSISYGHLVDCFLSCAFLSPALRQLIQYEIVLHVMSGSREITCHLVINFFVQLVISTHISKPDVLFFCQKGLIANLLLINLYIYSVISAPISTYGIFLCIKTGGINWLIVNCSSQVFPHVKETPN